MAIERCFSRNGPLSMGLSFHVELHATENCKTRVVVLGGLFMT